MQLVEGAKKESRSPIVVEINGDCKCKCKCNLFTGRLKLNIQITLWLGVLQELFQPVITFIKSQEHNTVTRSGLEPGVQPTKHNSTAPPIKKRKDLRWIVPVFIAWEVW